MPRLKRWLVLLHLLAALSYWILSPTATRDGEEEKLPIYQGIHQTPHYRCEPWPEFNDWHPPPSNDRKVAFVGDSVAFQMGRLWAEVMDGGPKRILAESSQVRLEVYDHTLIYRVTKMLTQSTENVTWSDWTGGGWFRSELESAGGQPWDVVVWRIPHPWVSFRHITLDAIQESIATLRETLQVSQVILVTIPFSNNIENAFQWKKLQKTNDLIRSIEGVQVLELDRLVDSFLEWNARRIGLIGEHWRFEQILSSTPSRRAKKQLVHPVALVCDSLPDQQDNNCPRNRFTVDGMHWCMETIGGRLVAALSCLMMERRTTTPTCNDVYMRWS